MKWKDCQMDPLRIFVRIVPSGNKRMKEYKETRKQGKVQKAKGKSKRQKTDKLHKKVKERKTKRKNSFLGVVFPFFFPSIFKFFK